MHLPKFLQRRCRRPTAARLILETLETRDLLSVNVQSAFRGQTGNPAVLEPPDTITAAGPDVIVEKNSGAKLLQQDLKSFFNASPLGGVLSQSDVVVAFDELAGRFVLGTLDFKLGATAATSRSRFDFAVSNDSNPLDGFTLARYDMNDGAGGFDFADYPRIGYNADAWVISFNMFPALPTADIHVDTLAIDKSTLAGHRVEVPGGSSNFTMTPASMHDARPGDPMWFTESFSPVGGSFGGNTISVVQMTNVLSNTPTFTITQVAVPDYFGFPFVFGLQPFSPFIINTDDSRMFNSAMRFGQIVAAQAVVDFDNFATHVRWYQFDTTGDAPILAQMGNINQGLNVNTYYPSIDINMAGDLGMTFMESSDSEYMSMYVTGRKKADPLNTMQQPVLVFAGHDVYQGGRAGDYSGTTVDPVDGITFWSANEYKPQDAGWGTGIASFSINNAAPPPGTANPPDSELLFLEPARRASSSLNFAVLSHDSVMTMPDNLPGAVIDGDLNGNKQQRRDVDPSAGDRSHLVREERANSDFWDSVSSQPLPQ